MAGAPASAPASALDRAHRRAAIAVFSAQPTGAVRVALRARRCGSGASVAMTGRRPSRRLARGAGPRDPDRERSAPRGVAPPRLPPLGRARALPALLGAGGRPGAGAASGRAGRRHALPVPRRRRLRADLRGQLRLAHPRGRDEVVVHRAGARRLRLSRLGRADRLRPRAREGRARPRAGRGEAPAPLAGRAPAPLDPRRAGRGDAVPHRRGGRALPRPGRRVGRGQRGLRGRRPPGAHRLAGRASARTTSTWRSASRTRRTPAPPCTSPTRAPSGPAPSRMRSTHSPPACATGECPSPASASRTT